jgi:hypothetical protein
MYIIVEIMHRIQKFCTGVVGIYIVCRKKVPTATTVDGIGTEDVVGIHVHCFSGNISDQMENIVYCQVF